MEKRSEKIDECDDLMAMFMKEVTKRKNDKDPHYFTEKQCNYLLSDLFGAGVETSVNTLRWFLLYMALNKDIQVNKNNIIKFGITFYYYYDFLVLIIYRYLLYGSVYHSLSIYIKKIIYTKYNMCLYA